MTMATRVPEAEFEEALSLTDDPAQWRSNFPGIPVEVARGYCGPFSDSDAVRIRGWDRGASRRTTQQCMRVWRLQHGFLNLAIAKTRELEEAKRKRLVSDEAAQITVAMRKLLKEKDRQEANITDDLPDGERKLRLQELARVGTELNRLDDLLNGRRDERLWMGSQTLRAVRACLNSASLGPPNIHMYDGKTRDVSLPYPIEHHAGYAVPEGEIHLVWVTETRGTNRKNLIVHDVKWQEKLDGWFTRVPPGYAPDEDGQVAVGQPLQTPQETVSFGAPPPQEGNINTVEQAVAAAEALVKQQEKPVRGELAKRFLPDENAKPAKETGYEPWTPERRKVQSERLRALNQKRREKAAAKKLAVAGEKAVVIVEPE
mgnify:CR=1 FL=1